jgi:hypothetical protein
MPSKRTRTAPSSAAPARRRGAAPTSAAAPSSALLAAAPAHASCPHVLGGVHVEVVRHVLATRHAHAAASGAAPGSCDGCGTRAGARYLCATCGAVGCGRLVQRHSLLHYADFGCGGAASPADADADDGGAAGAGAGAGAGSTTRSHVAAAAAAASSSSSLAPARARAPARALTRLSLIARPGAWRWWSPSDALPPQLPSPVLNAAAVTRVLLGISSALFPARDFWAPFARGGAYGGGGGGGGGDASVWGRYAAHPFAEVAEVVALVLDGMAAAGDRVGGSA